MTYQELIQKNNRPNYSELLRCQEWHDFREKIIQKDNVTCQICGVIAFKSMGVDFYLTTISEDKYNEIVQKSKIEYEKNPYILNPFYSESNPNSKISKYIKVAPFYKNLVPERSIKIEVHHKYYIKNHLPWEYSIDDLMTLCRSCHIEIHKNSHIIFYEDDEMNRPLQFDNCPKCSGTGYLDEYKHYLDGICFRCDGLGFSD